MIASVGLAGRCRIRRLDMVLSRCKRNLCLTNRLMCRWPTSRLVLFICTRNGYRIMCRLL